MTPEFVNKGQGETNASPDKTSSDVSFAIYILDYFFKMTDYFLKHHSRHRSCVINLDKISLAFTRATSYSTISIIGIIRDKIYLN